MGESKESTWDPLVISPSSTGKVADIWRLVPHCRGAKKKEQQQKIPHSRTRKDSLGGPHLCGRVSLPRLLCATNNITRRSGFVRDQLAGKLVGSWSKRRR